MSNYAEERQINRIFIKRLGSDGVGQALGKGNAIPGDYCRISISQHALDNQFGKIILIRPDGKYLVKLFGHDVQIAWLNRRDLTKIEMH